MDERKSIMLMQSGELTFAGAEFTKTQKKLLYEIIKNVQSLYTGVKVSECQNKPLDFADMLGQKYIIPIQKIISDSDNNYKRLKESLYEMSHKLVRVQENDSNFSIVSFFDKIEIPKDSGLIYVRMTLSFYEKMANLSRGLTVYDYEVVRNFESVYAMKMYEFIARWDTRPPRRIPLENLRNILGVNVSITENGKTVIKRKYENINGFEERTLKVAKEQIDDPKYKAAYRFDYKRITEKGKVVGYEISVFRNDNVKLSEREQRFESAKEHDSLYLEVPKSVIYKLKDFGFTTEELYPHIVLLKTFSKYYPDVLVILAELGSKSRGDGIENPKGYIIWNLRNKLETEKGVFVQPDGTVVTKTPQASFNDDIFSSLLLDTNS